MADNPIDIQKSLDGVEYPVTKSALVAKAKEKGDKEVVALLNGLPDREYASPADVMREFGER